MPTERTAVFRPIIVAATLIAVGGCIKADTHGGEAADHVAISGAPSWNNGIGELFARKCAVCHQLPVPASSPANVPTDLDLRYEKSLGDTRAAEDIAAPITLGLLRHGLDYRSSTLAATAGGGIRAMPPDFATPLYADEKAALEDWATAVIAAQAAYVSPEIAPTLPLGAADGAVLYRRYCQGCHGSPAGDGGVARRPLRGFGADAGPLFARTILSTSPQYPMYSWPVLRQLAERCTPSGAPTTCGGTQLDAIAAHLARF